MASGPQKSVLIISDGGADGEKLSRMMASAGFAVHQATDGPQALPLAVALKPLLIIVDMRPADGGAGESLRLLGENAATRALPVLPVCLDFVRAGETLREGTRRLEARARELDHSSRQIEEFVSIVSHDLRAPLVSIGGCVRLLMEEARDKPDEESGELLKLIQDSVDDMGALVKTLVAYTHVGAGGLTLAECDLGAVLAAVVSELQARLDETGGQVTHDPLPAVRAEESLIAQLLRILVENAIASRGTDPPRVHVSASEAPQEWTVSVRDNGIGIEPRDFEKVFRIHQQLRPDASTSQGARIGLALCRRIVEGHGGRIWLESEVARGTTFYFSLPRVAG